MGAWQKYGKAIAAVVLALITAIQSAVTDHLIHNMEWMQIIIAAVTAAGVYLVPVVPQYRWAKTAVGVLLSALNIVLTFVVDGWQTTDLVPCILAVVTAIAVTFSPAVSDTRPPTPAEP